MLMKTVLCIVRTFNSRPVFYFGLCVPICCYKGYKTKGKFQNLDPKSVTFLRFTSFSGTGWKKLSFGIVFYTKLRLFWWLI